MPSSPHLGAQYGVVGAYTGGNENVLRAMIAFAAISWYNSAELIILSLVTFKRYRGLYFWSLLITTIAIIPYTLGGWGRLSGIFKNNLTGMIMNNIGWIFMVNGESIVLYSRLHLVTDNQRMMRWLLIMICTNLVILYIPTTVLAFGSQFPGMTKFVAGYAVMEKIQMTIWSIQEIIISGVYLWEVRKILKVMYEKGTRKLLWELVAMNVACIALDAVLLAVEFMNLYQIEVALKSMVYSIKLKMEFAVLSKLVKVVTHSDENGMQRVTTAGTTDTEKTTIPISPLGPLSPAATEHMTAWPGSPTSAKRAEWVEHSDLERSMSSSEWRNDSIEFEPLKLRSVKREYDDDLYPGKLLQ